MKKSYRELESFKMPFGKYKDEKLANVPAQYLLWAEKTIDDLPEEVLDFIEETRDILERELLK